MIVQLFSTVAVFHLAHAASVACGLSSCNDETQYCKDNGASGQDSSDTCEALPTCSNSAPTCPTPVAGKGIYCKVSGGDNGNCAVLPTCVTVDNCPDDAASAPTWYCDGGDCKVCSSTTNCVTSYVNGCQDTADATCSMCKDGYYGDTCESPCSAPEEGHGDYVTDCANYKCQQSDGLSPQCYECTPGSYLKDGTSCETCSNTDNCAESTTCSQATPTTDSTCTKCNENTQWGEHCELTCKSLAGCAPDANKIECKKDSTSAGNDASCNKCQDGKHGTACTLDCPQSPSSGAVPGCSKYKCAQDTGLTPVCYECTSTTHFLDGTTCDECEVDDNCNTGANCGAKDGAKQTCGAGGCKPGYYSNGSQSCQACSVVDLTGCKEATCDGTTGADPVCKTCNKNYYLDSDTKTCKACSANCAATSVTCGEGQTTNTAKCDSCKPGFRGKDTQCMTQCSFTGEDNCTASPNQRSCSDDGKTFMCSTTGCAEGFWSDGKSDCQTCDASSINGCDTAKCNIGTGADPVCTKCKAVHFLDSSGDAPKCTACGGTVDKCNAGMTTCTTATDQKCKPDECEKGYYNVDGDTPEKPGSCAKQVTETFKTTGTIKLTGFTKAQITDETTGTPAQNALAGAISETVADTLKTAGLTKKDSADTVDMTANEFSVKTKIVNVSPNDSGNANDMNVEIEATITMLIPNKALQKVDLAESEVNKAMTSGIADPAKWEKAINDVSAIKNAGITADVATTAVKAPETKVVPAPSSDPAGTPAEKPAESGTNVGVILGVVFGCIAALLIGVVIYCKCCTGDEKQG